MRFLPVVLLLMGMPATAYAPRTPESVLADRVPGAAVQCITRRGVSDRSELFPGAILYKEGSVWYLNRPRDCAEIRSDRTVAEITPSNRLCSGDIVTVSQPVSRFVFGTCPLGEFVPYTRRAAQSPPR